MLHNIFNLLHNACLTIVTLLTHCDNEIYDRKMLECLRCLSKFTVTPFIRSITSQHCNWFLSNMWLRHRWIFRWPCWDPIPAMFSHMPALDYFSSDMKDLARREPCYLITHTTIDTVARGHIIHSQPDVMSPQFNVFFLLLSFHHGWQLVRPQFDDADAW